MYRIELAPGEETVFRTISELAVAVRNGLVTSRARIYHNASQKWLPIEFHPHYKQALELPPSRADARTPDRTEPLSFAVARADQPEISIAAPVSAAPMVAAPVSAAPMVEAPAAVELEAEAMVVEEPSAPPMALAPAVPSPVLRLPTTIESPEISDPEMTYPEFARAEAPAPDQASSMTRSRRPLHVVGAAAVLALAAYAMMSTFSPSRGAAASPRAVADRPAMPQADSLSADARRPDAPPAGATRVDSEAATPPAVAKARPGGTGPRASTSVAMTEPASSGFAPALESRAIVSTSPAVVLPATPDDSTIAPAPVALDMAVPALPGAESLVATPRPQGDSAALKRILRAVNGGKDAPQRP
jgi:Meckel syndrome type 1 protein